MYVYIYIYIHVSEWVSECTRVAECWCVLVRAGPASSTSRWRGGTGACSGRTSRWACRAFQVFLFCLVYLRMWGRCWRSILSNQKTIWYRNCGFAGLRFCDVCRKAVEDSQDAADVEDWMSSFVSNTWGFLSHMRVVLLRFQSDLILRLLSIINVWRAN